MFRLQIFTLVLLSSFFLILDQTTILGQGVQQSPTTITIIPGASEPGTENPFFPSSLNLPIGSIVNWTNKDQLIHTVTSFTKSFDSGMLSPNQYFNNTFYTPGYYNYYCSVHPYMNGEITIR